MSGQMRAIAALLLVPSVLCVGNTDPPIGNTDPPIVAACPVGFAVSTSSSPGSSSSRTGSALASAPTSSPLSSGGEGECRCEKFDNATKPFEDRNHTYCGHIPSPWQDAYHFSCPHCMGGWTGINITCPNAWETCEIVVNLYLCPGCSSSGGNSTNGLWPSSLSADGWAASVSCVSAGAFCTDSGRHGFVGFHKTILGSDTEVLPETATDPTMYFSIVVMEGRICGQINNVTECGDSSMCEWDYMGLDPPLGVCKSSVCHVKNSTEPGGSCMAAGCAPGTPGGDCNE